MTPFKRINAAIRPDRCDRVNSNRPAVNAAAPLPPVATARRVDENLGLRSLPES